MEQQKLSELLFILIYCRNSEFGTMHYTNAISQDTLKYAIDNGYLIPSSTDDPYYSTYKLSEDGKDFLSMCLTILTITLTK